MSTRLEAHKILSLDAEEAVLSAYLDAIRPGDVVYDIGANLGLYAIPVVARFGDAVHLAAFEPFALWADRLEANVSLNEAANVRVHRVALFRKAGRAGMVVKPGLGSGMGSLVTRYPRELAPSQLAEVQVPLRAGDDLANEGTVPWPNVVKIDVEGAESDVLAGMKEAVSRASCRFVCCELHPELGGLGPDTSREFLRDSGFRSFRVIPREREFMLLAWKKPLWPGSAADVWDSSRVRAP